MAASKHFLVLVCAALLALGACTDTKHVRTPDPAAIARADAEKKRADALAAELAALRTSLVNTQERLADNEDIDLDDIQNNVDNTLENLPPVGDASDADNAVRRAMTEIRTALTEVSSVLADNAAMASPGGGGRFLRGHARLAGSSSGGAERRS